MAVDILSIPAVHKPQREGSIRNILHTYPDPTNIISEFIQNAEDANARSIKFEVSEIGSILSASSGVIPKLKASVVFGSASIANTLNPFCMNIRANKAAMVVLPVPPFPDTAIFIFSHILKINLFNTSVG